MQDARTSPSAPLRFQERSAANGEWSKVRAAVLEAADRLGKRLFVILENLALYSMYYKLRRERDEAAVVENLIRFIVACYGGTRPLP